MIRCAACPRSLQPGQGARAGVCTLTSWQKPDDHTEFRLCLVQSGEFCPWAPGFVGGGRGLEAGGWVQGVGVQVGVAGGGSRPVKPCHTREKGEGMSREAERPDGA